jgi:hypothetical protein
MSKLGCSCGHSMTDNTDFLPYKAHLREDEDTQKPIELLADVLERFWEARQRGQQDDFLRQFTLSEGESDTMAELVVKDSHNESLAQVLFHLIFPFWNNYDRVIYECEECGRLWVELEGNRFAPYLPETEARHVLWSRRNHNPYGYLDE